MASKDNIKINPEIKKIKIGDIKPWDANPRDITEEALQGLRQSLMQFGYIDLIIVNKRNMRIISGHQRYKILKEAGVKSIPCVMIDANEMRHQLISISLNNQQIVGFWTQALIPILEKLRQGMPDDYINLRIQELREEVNHLEMENMGNTLPDDIPPVPKKAITKLGDLWILGKHRLLCGDSTKKADVERLMDGKKAQLFATDPPYMVDYTGANRPKTRKRRRSGKDWSGSYHEVNIKDATRFFMDFYSVGLKHVQKNAALYLWHASRRSPEIQEVFKKLDIFIHQDIIWAKPAMVITFSVYPWRHEACLFGWQKGHKPFYRISHSNKIGTVWPVGLLRTGDPESPEYYSDLWEIDWEGKQRSTRIEHPTVKPTEIFARPMRIHTKPGDICYEPFSGSGSQIIAAERLNRRCFAMELQPLFIDVAVKRWEDFTGKKAKRSGRNKK